MYTFFFWWYDDQRDLHSFPTRRSSDLVAQIPEKKLFCIYGEEEKEDTGCLQPEMKGEAFQLPGGHHFDENYQHLGQIIMQAIDKRMQ